jgi:hypothetical protein
MSSGRPRHRNICESCLAIDVRQLHREGRLLAYQSFPLSWRCDGQPFGSIRVNTDHDLLILRFQIKEVGDASFNLIEQRVPIVWTACALGGRRPWLFCNAESAGISCNHRVAKIYLGGGPVFACRRCHSLSYSSQSSSPFHRDIAKAMKIRMKLGGSPNLLEPFPARPKGLHKRTYERLRKIHDEADSRLG